MVIKFIGIFVATMFLFLSSCTDLTEFDHAMQAGVNIVSSSDFSVVHTIENISGAGSLCFLPDCFIVATTDGKVIRFDSQTYEQTGSFVIGSPSSSGYFEIEYSPTENSVYIIGAFGQILELHVPDMELMDSFSICEAPVDIEIGTQIELPYMYVAGAASSKIFEVNLNTHNLTRTCLLESSPTCMAIGQAQDTIVVGTVGKTEIVSIVPGIMRTRQVDHILGISAIEPIPNDTTLCAIFNNYSTDAIVTILNYMPPEIGGGGTYTGKAYIQGNLHYMCAKYDPYGNYVYVLSYLGDNVSRLVSYSCNEYLIENELDLTGYPVDLEISSGGTLLVLTAE